MKGAGMLVISLRGWGWGKFWILVSLRVFCTKCHLALKVSFRVAPKKTLYFLFGCVFKWSLFGVKKSLGHAQFGLL